MCKGECNIRFVNCMILTFSLAFFIENYHILLLKTTCYKAKVITLYFSVLQGGAKRVLRSEPENWVQPSLCESACVRFFVLSSRKKRIFRGDFAPWEIWFYQEVFVFWHVIYCLLMLKEKLFQGFLLSCQSSRRGYKNGNSC